MHLLDHDDPATCLLGVFSHVHRRWEPPGSQSRLAASDVSPYILQSLERHDRPQPGRWQAPPPMVLTPTPDVRLLARDATMSFPIASSQTSVGGMVVVDCDGLVRDLVLVNGADPPNGRPLCDEEYALLHSFSERRQHVGDPVFVDDAGPLTDLLRFPPDQDREADVTQLRYQPFEDAEDGTFSIVVFDPVSLAGWYVLDQEFTVRDSVGLLPGSNTLPDNVVTGGFLQRRLNAGDPVVEHLADYVPEEA